MWMKQLENYIWQNTDAYMSMACWPRISGRCLWSGAGEGSATERCHWLLFGCCLAGTGSDLEGRMGGLFYASGHFWNMLLDEGRHAWNEFKIIKILFPLPPQSQCEALFHKKWNMTFLSVNSFFYISLRPCLSLTFTSLRAQSVVLNWGGIVPLCLLTGQLPVQFVHFDVLNVAPWAHPSLQVALRTWDI